MNTTTEDPKTERIRKFNGTFRSTFLAPFGKVAFSEAVSALPDAQREEVITKVRTFSDFQAGDDPYSEHDFGAFELEGTKYFWKIDYWDKAMEYGSEDPSDTAKTMRLLTIMQASEY